MNWEEVKIKKIGEIRQECFEDAFVNSKELQIKVRDELIHFFEELKKEMPKKKVVFLEPTLEDIDNYILRYYIYEQ